MPHAVTQEVWLCLLTPMPFLTQEPLGAKRDRVRIPPARRRHLGGFTTGVASFFIRISTRVNQR